MAASLSRALSTLNNITVINGRENPGAKEVAEQFVNLNPTIETYRIVNSKLLPQLEQPLELYKILKGILNK